MVRKVIAMLLCVILIAAMAAPVYAVTHTVYDSGAPSSTYLTYFRDILSGTSFKDNYVAFRDGQNSYIMVVGDLEYNNGQINLNGAGTSYTFKSDGTNYNTQYRYYVDEINTFSLNTNNYIVYSDVGEYPQLIERGAKYEILTAVLICVALLCVVIYRIFRKR